MNHLVVDLEATCCNRNSFPRTEMEIIEIGAVMVDSSFQFIDEFQAFVRPVRNSILTDFCRELTTISQEDVDSAPTFNVVIGEFSNWLERFDRYDFCSWGEYDLKQFNQDCRFHGVVSPLKVPHRNLKEEFSSRLRLGRKYGMAGALTKIGLQIDGTHHRGIDDAKNIARIFQHLESSKFEEGMVDRYGKGKRKPNKKRRG